MDRIKISIPYGCQDIDESDIQDVVAALRGELLTGGKVLAEFEGALASRFAARYAIACSSGTAALHLGTLTLGLKERDAVIVPAVTFLATANCARYVGAEVVFADVDRETGLLTDEGLEEAITRSLVAGFTPRAVIPMHYAGQVSNVGKVAEAHGLTVLEDAAHAIGSKIVSDESEKIVGDCSDSEMTIFSFHPVKTITTGEGGAILTNDEERAFRLRKLRNHGMSRNLLEFQMKELAFSPGGIVNPWYYEMAEPGFNYRLTDIQSALGLSQLRRLDRFVARRRQIVDLYDKLFRAIAPTAVPLRKLQYCEPAWHLYVLLIEFEKTTTDRRTLMEQLAERGIGTQVHYLPVYRQPYYANRYGPIRLPGAEAFYERAISLPLFPALRDIDVQNIAELVSGALTKS